MKQEEINLYEVFSKYNAEKEGDIDIIKSTNPKRPDIKYLKWMRGWIEVLKIDPDATYDFLPDPSGSILHHIGSGGMVHVEVSILGKTKREWYPIERSPMQPVPFDDINPSQVNKAMKRGMVKCLALFGLASNLYLNDELTEAEKDESIESIKSLIAETKTLDDLVAVYNAYKDIIDKTPRVKAMFTARKQEIAKSAKNDENVKSAKSK